MHHIIEGNDVILIFANQKIVIHNASKVGKFLNHACKKTFVTHDDFTNYWLSKLLCEILVSYGILLDVSSFKSGAESFSLHSLAANPNKVDRDISDEQQKTLYDDVQYGLHAIINRDVFPKDNTLSFSMITDLHHLAPSSLCESFSSTRHNQSLGVFDKEYLLFSLKFINSPKQGKMIFWSGGGFYSIFQIVVTSENSVYISDNKNLLLYSWTFDWIFDDFCKTILEDSEYTPTSYGAIVLVMSNTKNVLKKYGNRGYRFLMLESGAIGLLYRILYSERGYLELGWYYDALVHERISKYAFFKNTKDLLLTHFILLSH